MVVKETAPPGAVTVVVCKRVRVLIEIPIGPTILLPLRVLVPMPVGCGSVTGAGKFA